jgi:hypothetical protein
MRGSRSLRSAYESARTDGSPQHLSKAAKSRQDIVFGAFLTTPSSTSTSSSFLHFDHTISPSRHNTSPPNTDRAPPSTAASRPEHQSPHIAAGPMGTATVLLVVDTVLRNLTPVPLPRCDTSLNHQYSSRWALGTSYCRPVADTLPPIPDPIRPQPRPSRHDTGLKHQPCISRALGTACVPLSSTTSTRSISSEPRTQQTHLCRSLCSQLASQPHDHHRHRPCSQLASDRITAHPAPTLRKPLLPTSKLAAHKLFQHPQVMYHPFLCTHTKIKCVLMASVVTAA